MLTPDAAVSRQTDVKLVRGGTLHAPEPRGRQDILLCNGRIISIGTDLEARAAALGDVEIVDVSGKSVVPGFIDQHCHFLGGGDMDGPMGRVPELHASWLTRGGVCTAVSMLGSERGFKNLHGLLVKAQELKRVGLTTYIFTGSQEIPSPTITGDVQTDVVLIDKVLGAKVAFAEDKYPNLDPLQLAELAGKLIRASRVSGKAAVLHCHIGNNPRRLDQLFDLLDRIAIPVTQIVPTHVNRAAPDTIPAAVRFAKMGGTVDITAVMTSRWRMANVHSPDIALRMLLDAGVPLGQITMSSDSNVARPIYDLRDQLIGFRPSPPIILHREWCEMISANKLSLSEALPIVTSNVARVLKLEASKGRLREGGDADITVLDSDLRIDSVLCRGKIMVRHGLPVVIGPQEEFDPADVGF